MTFPTVEYIEWIAGRPDEAAHDLATTGLRGRHDTPVIGADPPADTEQSVEALLAEAYGVEESSVVVTAGATEANFLALATMIGESDRVVVERPGYEAHWKTPAGLGASVDRFDRTPESEFRLDPDRIAGAVTSETAAVLVSNRHNPSGQLSSTERLERAAKAAGDTPLLVDEVYAPYVRSADSQGGFGGPTAAGLDGVVVTGSLSKFFGYRELRLGWLIADPGLAEAIRSTKIHLGGTSELSRRYGAAVLSGAQQPPHTDDQHDESVPARALYADHADRLSAFLESRSDLSVPGSVQTSYAFPAHERASGSEVADAAADAGVLVVPGRFFGDDDRFRIGLGKSPTEMDAALDALGAVLDGL